MAKICRIDGCTRYSSARQMCHLHYGRWRRTGNPLTVTTVPGDPLKFFQEEVLPSSDRECVSWPFSRDRDGYGLIHYGGRTRGAHRLACELVHGPPPTPSHVAAHSCGNGHIGCVNPSHVRWATQHENNIERDLFGRTARGEKNAGAKLTEDAVRRIRTMKGSRSEAEIGEEFGVSQATISRIFTGRTWRCVK